MFSTIYGVEKSHCDRSIVPFSRVNFYEVISPKIEKLPGSNFASCFYGYNDRYKVLFQSVDVDLEFLHPGL